MIINPNIYPAPGGGGGGDGSEVYYTEASSVGSSSITFSDIITMPSWFIAFPFWGSLTEKQATVAWVMGDNGACTTAIGREQGSLIIYEGAIYSFVTVSSSGLRFRSFSSEAVYPIGYWGIIYKK